MSFDAALRITEILLALVLLQQSAEHLHLARAASAHASFQRARASADVDTLLFGARLLLALGLLFAVAPAAIGLLLLASTAVYLHRYDGAFNGGADRMGVLILICLTLAHLAPNQRMAELALGYLAAQLTLSYFISGWVKLVNPAWRRGEALREVFLFSAYPVSEGLRHWAGKPGFLLVASWAVILLEVLFPLALLSQQTLAAALALTGAFHLGNALFFGLN